MRTTGVRLIAHVTQYIRELRRAGDQTHRLGGELDSARIKGARMANEVATSATASARQLNVMREHVEKLDKQIDATRKNITMFARGFAETGDTEFVKIIQKQQKELKNLVSIRNLLPDPSVIAKEAAKLGGVFGKNFTNQLDIRLVTASIPALVALVPTMGAIIAGAVVGAAGAGGVVGGIVLAARDERVKAAGANLGTTIMQDLEDRAARFVLPTLNGIERIRLAWRTLGPDLDRVFAASRFVEPLTEGAIRGGQAFVKGFADAIAAADPVMEAIRNMIAQLGSAVGQLFTIMARNADVGAAALNDLSMAASNLIETTARFVESAAAVYRFNEALDQNIDRIRYFIEDNFKYTVVLGEMNKQIDLTGDGFKAGSAAAEAYRKATLGTADAADFATLRQNGYTEAQVAAIDSSGRYRAELSKVTAGVQQVGVSEEARKETQAALTLAQGNLTLAQNAYKSSLDNVAPALARSTALADGLRTAQQNLYGSAIAGVEANEAYEASWDKLGESIKDNGRSLDINTLKGRANRDSLEELLTASNDMYFANIAQGDSTDLARRKHEARTKSIQKEADKLHLDKKRTQELIATYGKIPPNRTTKIIQTGLKGIQKALGELYIAQRALADGITVTEARKQYLAKNSAAVFTGHADGGWTGPGSKYQPAGIVHADEFVIQKKSRRKIEAQHPGLLDQMNSSGQFPGHATGGLVAPVETRDWPFPVNMSHTKVMSRADALSRVTPAVPAGGRTANWIVAAARALVGAVRVISKDRPGARTSSGNVSYHALGRAVDFAPSMQLARKWNLAYGSRTKEEITPWRQYDIRNGRPYHYSAGLHAEHSGGNAHVHIAMKGGGTVREPVFGVGRSGATYSFGEGGVHERVIPIGQGGGASGGTTITVAPTIIIQGANQSPQQIARAVDRQIGGLADVFERS